MSFDPVSALVAYHAALDSHNVDLVETLLADTATYQSAAVGMLQGRQAIVDAMRGYFAAHPDHRAWDEAVSQTGKQQAHSIWQLQTTDKTTGEKIHRRGEETIDFDANGKIICVTVIDH